MKKTVLFATAIALVIALATTGVLAANKTTETGNANAGRVDGTVETGKVDGKVEATASSDLNKTLPNENAERIDESSKVETESNEEYDWELVLRNALKEIEEKYTVGTLSDFGVTDWRSKYAHIEVIPLSEYEELDESLQFLNDYDFYLPVCLMPGLFPDLEEYSTINEMLLEHVETVHQKVRSMIADGSIENAMHSGGYRGFIINVPEAQFLWDEIFYAVADYYFGYSL